MRSFNKTKTFFFAFGLAACSLLFCFRAFSEETDTDGRIVQTEPVLEGSFTNGSAMYTLGKGDVVEILVRNQPEFSGQFIIGPDGKIQYKFVGDLKAEGLTKDELKESVANQLERYVKVPEVSVTISAYRSKFIYMLGELARPGKYPMMGDEITLREAIVASGLPTPDAALRRVYIIKPDETKPVYRKVDIYRLLYKGELKDNINLTPGDLVVVSSTVPTEITRALNKLLSPITRAAIIEDLFNR